MKVIFSPYANRTTEIEGGLMLTCLENEIG